MSQLWAENISVGYGETDVIDDLSICIESGKITVIIGPNACGKSTLLKSLARLVKPKAGHVMLDNTNIHSIPSKSVARSLGFLPQSPITPPGITVMDLVGRGRTPHQSFLQQWSQQDENIVFQAMEATGILEIADKPVDQLSGGQRQKVWIAMVLAQNTDIVLLDEPTTFLDLPKQIEVLNLVKDLNQKENKTFGIVLHDINLACRYADNIIAMRQGEILAQGSSQEVITVENMQRIFDLDCQIILDPVLQTPLVVAL